jgi:hypothetical protein
MTAPAWGKFIRVAMNLEMMLHAHSKLESAGGDGAFYRKLWDNLSVSLR